MNINELKREIEEVLQKDEIIQRIGSISSLEEIYYICLDYFPDVPKEIFINALEEMIQEGTPFLEDDLETVAAGLKAGQLYLDN